MSKLRRRLVNVLGGSGQLRVERIVDLPGYGPGEVVRLCLEIGADERERERVRSNALNLLLWFRGPEDMTDGQHAAWVSLVAELGEPVLAGALVETDRLLARPRLSGPEVEALTRRRRG